MALWNVAAGAEPADLRAALRAALPDSPRQQIVKDRAILHTTVARLLRPPLGPMGAVVRDAGGGGGEGGRGGRGTADGGDAARRVVAARAGIRALALGGEYEPETMPFACEAGGGRGLE